MRNDIVRAVGVLSFALSLGLLPSIASAAWWTPGAAPAPAAPATRQAPVAPVQLAQGAAAERFNRIEAQMRTLTGQVEELTYQLRQLQDQLKRMQEDNEFRFGELERGAGATPRVPGAAANEQAPVPTLAPPGQSDAIGAVAGGLPAPPDLTGPGAPPQPLGTLTLDAPFPSGIDQPLDLTQPLLSATPDVAMIAPTGDPRTDYDRAYGSILNGDYANAEVAFRRFLDAYPNDALAPDAQYWLGESLFVRAQYRDAANEFLAGYKAYPKSGKAPDALLKLGLSLSGLGEREAACRTFDAVLRQYPDASNALRQRVKFEQSSAGC